MIDMFKRTFIVGLLVLLSFLVSMLMLKQFLLDEEMTNCREKISFLEKDMQFLIKATFNDEYNEE